MTAADRRYAVTLEWCGYATRRYVVRFCDTWVGQAETSAAARALADEHATQRDRILRGLS